MIKIKSHKEEEETYVEDDDGFWSRKVPEETFYYLTTRDQEPKTGEIRIMQVPSEKLPTSPRFIFTSGISDFLESIEMIKAEIEQLKQENEEIRNKLKERQIQSEVIKIRDIPDHKIEKLIIKYLKKHEDEEIYPSDIAFAFNLDAKKVFNICLKIKKEGKLA